MKVAIIGCGSAGSKVVDKMLDIEQRMDRHFIAHTIAVNSATADFDALANIPPTHQILIGEAETKGHGAGTDNEVGAKIAKQDIHKIQRAVGDIPIHDVDAFFVSTSFGGGTGSGCAPVIAGHISDNYDEPVYGLGILPAKNEGGIYQLNSARSLPALTENTDNVIIFDNEVWRKSGQSISASYSHANEQIAKRFVTMFGAGERDQNAPENVLDSSEIIKTLECGGISSIGYSRADLSQQESQSGLLNRFKNGNKRPNSERKETKIVGLIRQATTGQLTLPCDISSTSKALTLVTGPTSELSRSGIENGKLWLEEQCNCLEVRGGDDPRDTQDYIAGLVLLSGVTTVPRIDEFQKQAVEAQDSIENMESKIDEGTEELVHDEGGDIDSLL